MTDYLVRENETLRDIAARQLGNVNEWFRIVILNNLDYPYIGVLGTAYEGNVVLPGGKIRLPSSDVLNKATYFATRNTQNLDYAQLFLGTDIGLTDGKLTIVAGTTGKDLFLVSGSQNLVQAITNKFLTPLGALRYYPKYGSRVKKSIGETSDNALLNIIKADCAKTVRQDSRISNVKSITVISDGADKVAVQLQVDTKAGIGS